MMRFFPDYRAHIIHTTVAEPRSEIWRLLLGVVAMVGVYVLFAMFYQQAIFELARYRPTFEEELLAGSTPLAMYALLFSFGLFTLSVFGVVKVLHKRDGLSVLGPLILAVPQFFRVIGMLLLVWVVLTVLPPYDMGGPLVPNMASLSIWDVTSV